MANAEAACGTESSCQKLNLNVKNSQGNTPLHMLVAKTYTNRKSEEAQKLEETDVKTLKLMLKFHPDVNLQSSEGYTCVHLAIKNKRSDALVKVFLDYKGDCDYNLTDKEGCSALYHAVSPISYKLDMEAEYRYSNSDHFVKIPAKYSNFNFKFRDALIIKNLVDKGAKIDTAAKNGYSPLLLAVVMQKTDYVKVMLENKDKLCKDGLEQTIHAYVCEDHYQTKSNSYLNNVSRKVYPPETYYHMTPLKIAVYDNNMEMADLLIKAGANVNAICDLDKKTPLLMSVKNGSLKIVQLLITAGANVNAVSEVGDNALHMITKAHKATEEQTEIAKLLIDNGIDLNAEDKSGETALHLAISRDKQDIVSHILEQGLATL